MKTVAKVTLLSKAIKILVGADPELFLRNPNSRDFVSAHGMIPGTKDKPHPVPFGAVQVDGTAVEFNIDPAESCDQFVHNIAAVRADLETMCSGYTVDAIPVAEYSDEYFQSIPAEAKELGCNPDFNGWTGEQNPAPDGEVTFRTGSGHVHIGWGEGFNPEDHSHMHTCAALARHLDYRLGIYTLLWDRDNRRRDLYGKAGAFRPKPYGMEYRVPSNAWLKSEQIQRFVYDSIQSAMTDFMAGDRDDETYGNIAQMIIDENITEWPEIYPYLDRTPLKVAA